MSARESPSVRGREDPWDHVVLGDDLSGLAYAFWRRARGSRVVVLGGRAVEVDRDDGASLLFPARDSCLDRLLEQLPDAPAVTPAPIELAPPRLWLPSGLRPWRLSARLRPRRWLPVDPASTGAPPETLARFARRRFGEGRADAYVAAIARLRWGEDPRRLGAADACPRLVAARRFRRAWEVLDAELDPALARRPRLLDGGAAALAASVRDALGSSLRRGTTARAITIGRDGRWPSVELEDGRTIEGREIVLALPAGEQAAWIAPLAPLAAELLRGLSSAARLEVAVRIREVDLPPEGVGAAFLVGPGAPTRMLGARLAPAGEASGAPTNGARRLELLYGGAVDPEALSFSDGQVARVVEADLRRWVGRLVRPVELRIRRGAPGVILPRPGHRGRVAGIQCALAERGIRLLGSHVTGEGLEARVRTGAPPGEHLPEGLALA